MKMSLLSVDPEDLLALFWVKFLGPIWKHHVTERRQCNSINNVVFTGGVRSTESLGDLSGWSNNIHQEKEGGS